MIDKIKSIIADALGMDADEIVDNATMSEIVGDEMDIVKIVIDIEDGFGIAFSDDESWAVQEEDMTVAELAAVVERKVQG